MVKIAESAENLEENMIKNTIKTNSLLITFSVLMFLLNGMAYGQAKDERAELVLKQARQAVYTKTNISDIKTIYIKRMISTQSRSSTIMDGSTDPQVQIVNRDTDEEILFQIPNKAKLISTSYTEGKNSVDNFARLETVLNGSETSSEMKIVRNGKAADLESVLAKMPPSMSVLIKNKIDLDSPNSSFTRTSLWETTFPIMLENPLDFPLSFSYIGKAEFNRNKMDVIEAKLEQNKTYRLFFDEKTHLLSLMIPVENLGQGNNEIETKYFYSDYQLINGLMVAKKINIETISNIKDIKAKIIIKEIEIPKAKQRETRMLSEINVKELKLNMTFKPNTFDIKKGN